MPKASVADGQHRHYSASWFHIPKLSLYDTILYNFITQLANMGIDPYYYRRHSWRARNVFTLCRGNMHWHYLRWV